MRPKSIIFGSTTMRPLSFNPIAERTGNPVSPGSRRSLGVDVAVCGSAAAPCPLGDIGELP